MSAELPNIKSQKTGTRIFIAALFATQNLRLPMLISSRLYWKTPVQLHNGILYSKKNEHLQLHTMQINPVSIKPDIRQKLDTKNKNSHKRPVLLKAKNPGGLEDANESWF